MWGIIFIEKKTNIMKAQLIFRTENNILFLKIVRERYELIALIDKFVKDFKTKELKPKDTKEVMQIIRLEEDAKFQFLNMTIYMWEGTDIVLKKL